MIASKMEDVMDQNRKDQNGKRESEFERQFDKVIFGVMKCSIAVAGLIVTEDANK